VLSSTVQEQSSELEGCDEQQVAHNFAIRLEQTLLPLD